MSGPLPDFVLLRPASIGEAVTMRSRHAGSRLLAGGTDLIANMRRGLVEASTLIDVSAIPELGSITLEPGGLRIGAGVTLARLASDEHVQEQHAAVAEASEAIAGPGHRTCATVGGNLCLDTRCVYYNQSHWWRKSNGFCLKYRGDICHVAPEGERCRAAFSGDLAPALIVHEAEAEIAGPQGTRRMPLGALYRNDGAAHLTLGPDELMTAVVLPAAGWRSGYAKARVRDSIDFPLAGVAAALRRESRGAARLRLAVTGTDSRPFLIEGLDDRWTLPPDDSNLARLDRLVQKQVSPVRTTTAAAHYRRLAAAALAKRLVTRLATEHAQ